MAQQDEAVIEEAAEEQPAEETAVQDSPPQEEQTAEESQETEVKEESQEEAPAEETEEDTEEAKVSPRLQKRVRDLSQKVKEARQSQQPQNEATQQFNQSKSGIEPGDYTPEQLEELINQRAQQQAASLGTQTQTEIQKLRREIEEDRLLNDLARSTNTIETTYEELNPNSEKFNPELADAVGDTIQDTFLANPYIDVEKLTERIVKASRAVGTAQAKQVGQKVAEQASNQAVKSDLASTPKDTKFEELSIEEMESKLGYAQQ